METPDVCSICHSEFSGNVVKLSCNHSLHLQCCMNLLHINNDFRCPLCRGNLNIYIPSSRPSIVDDDDDDDDNVNRLSGGMEFNWSFKDEVLEDFIMYGCMYFIVRKIMKKLNE